MKKYCLLSLVVLVLAACTTQKKKDELGGLQKVWHNTTAHYNGYFNAEEILTESTLLLEEQHQDNYLKLLDVYEYSEVDNPQSVAEQLDEAIKKVTVVINLHPISRWSDDCYLLAGKALFLKQDYEGAEKAFRYLLNNYPPVEKEAEEAKSKSSRSGSNKRSGRDRGTASETEEAPKKMTARERDKARKAYNREVKKRKKQRERDKKRGVTTSRRSSTNTQEDTEQADTTPTPTPPAAAPTTEPAEPVEAPVGMVRLSDKAEAISPESRKGGKLKHRPAYQEGQLWLARTFIERDNYDGARRILQQLNESANTYQDVKREVAVAQSHLFLREKNYELAAQALDRATDMANDKDQRARLHFILAQVQQKLGNSQAALAAFEKVVRARPNYDMEFAARLQIAQNSYLSGAGSAADAIANLTKLSKDDKNEPYLDQVYFAMAKIELLEGNKPEGMAYLQQSLSQPSTNKAQQAEAYYTLGTIFYDQEEYLSAKLYYDSTLTLMRTIDERYVPTERLRDNLVDIAQNIATIQLQDSLLRLAALSPEERADFAKNLLEQQRAEAGESNTGPAYDKFSRRNELSLGSARSATAGSAGGALRTNSDFWAYNDQTVKRGKRDFSRRWGDRPLTDDWRRSSALPDNPTEVAQAEEEIDINLLTEDQINEILKDVPDDDNAKQVAELEIKKAMFNLGRLYRERLDNNEKSVDVLEELNERFPGHLFELDSWYYLYLAHSDLGQSSKANEYREKILNKYPTTNYGKILIDPNYASIYLNEEKQLDRDYAAAYQLFSNGDYGSALSAARTNLPKLVGKHPLKPRYALLMAMCTGNTEGKDAYIGELRKVIGNYPNTPEETRAKEILRLLGAGGASLPGRMTEEAGSFKVNDTELHYIIIVFESDDIDLNENKIIVSDYNRQFHSLDKLRISNVYLGEKNNVPVLVLRRFKDKTAAMSYFEGVEKNAGEFIDSGNTPFRLFPITQSNYREVLRNRSVGGYDAFFENNY